jgi:hypothetical protein
MSEEKKVAAEMKLSLSEEMHLGFLESMAKTNTEKITRYLFTYFSWKTLLNHVFEDLRKPKAPNNPLPLSLTLRFTPGGLWPESRDEIPLRGEGCDTPVSPRVSLKC